VLMVLPRGDYVVKVTRSDLVRYNDHTAVLTLFLSCRGQGRICETALQFHIFDPDPEKEQIERRRLLDIAEAVGVADDFDDSDQLHGIPFRLTVWRDAPVRFSCRPMRERGVDVGDVASGKGMHPLAHHIILGADGDGDGPHAA
jgi:hypothetical protein